MLSDDAKGHADAAQKNIDAIQMQLASSHNELQCITSGGEVSEQKRRLSELDGEIQRLKNRHWMEKNDVERKHRESIQSVEDKFNDLIRQMKTTKSDLAAKTTGRDRIVQELDQLRDTWNKEDARQFVEPDQDTVCPACGQDIPQGRIDEVRDMALMEFNQAKAERLESIRTQGKAKASEIEIIENKINGLDVEAKNIQIKIDVAKTELNQKRAEPAPSVPEPDELASLEQERSTVLEKIGELSAGLTDMAESVKAEISILQEKLQHQQGQLAMAETYRKGLARIEELKADERRLATEYEMLEGELFLSEEFIRSKVKLLEERINSRFAIARFKLFAEQINGGITECCEMTVGGVPYDSLNRAAKLQGGLDIINTLSDHCGFNPVVFIDNAEAVTSLPEMNAQMIRLFVDESAKELRQTNEIKGAA